MKTMRSRVGLRALASLALVCLLGACSSSNKPTNPGDTTPPADVTNLAPGLVTPTTVALTWTAPGNDGNTGTAHQYDIRYSAAMITAANFASATAVAGAPAPAAAGTTQAVTVSGLHPSTPYYFALKTADAVPNWSGISNVATATTTAPPDTIPPSAVADLTATDIDSSSVQLQWTAPGDNGNVGTAHAYDIRYATSAINAASFATATAVTGAPAPATAGTVQQMVVHGLRSNTDYYFAMKTSDAVPNWSAISNLPAVVHTQSAPPPPLAGPAFPDSVCITSQDPNAQSAKTIAQAALNLVDSYVSLGTSFFGPLAGAQWQANGECWAYDTNQGGCPDAYLGCLSGQQYTYMLTINGSCNGHNYTNWVAARVLANFVSRAATFYAYEDNSTNVAAAWNWTWAADDNSGLYSFYQGDPAHVPLNSVLNWSRSVDQNTYDMTFVASQTAKFVGHFVKSPCSGTMQTFQWDAGLNQFWKQNDIAWISDGTGRWDVYDNTGALLQHHTW